MDTASPQDDPIPDRGPALIITMWFLTALSLGTLALRLVFRARKKQIGWEDIFMGWSSVLTLYANRGGCQHLWNVEKRGADNLERVILLNWMAQIFGIIGVATGKISISALLLHITRDGGWKWQRVYLWTVTIALTSCVAISCSLLTFLQCSPPSRLWDSRISGTCIDPKIMAGYGIFTGSFYTFVDASLAVIPLTIFSRLRISMLQRIQLCIVFGLNILTSICSGIKTQYLAELGNRTDQTWATYDIFAWVTAELFLLIVCGTVPTLYPLLRGIQSLLAFVRSKVARRSSSSEEALRQSDEVLTVGKIRMRMQRDATALASDESRNEAQLSNKNDEWRIRARPHR